MHPTEVTVEAAMKRGMYVLKVAPLLVMLLSFIGVGVLSNALRPPGWLIASMVVMSFLTGWLTWSLLVTHWRIWALQRVRNTHELLDTAVAEKLIWPKGSWFERTEIRTTAQKSLLIALGVRLSTPDVWQDDPQVPDYTEVRWSRKERVATSAIVLFVAGLGGYMIYQNLRDIWGWALLVTVLGFGIMDIRKMSDRRVQVRLDDHGITLQEKRSIPWSSISQERILVKGSGRRTITVLEFDHRGDRVDVQIDQLNIPKAKLRHRLRVYRFRSGHFTAISS